jgi:hypothetical protein
LDSKLNLRMLLTTLSNYSKVSKPPRQQDARAEQAKRVQKGLLPQRYEQGNLVSPDDS